jgi:hypothetical protein
MLHFLQLFDAQQGEAIAYKLNSSGGKSQPKPDGLAPLFAFQDWPFVIESVEPAGQFV